MKIRTLIVDDEPLARERLASLLQRNADLQIIGECGDGREAVAFIERERPDLIFLDIQMPELDGFGVLAQLPKDKMPVVVFVTAYDKFAVRAFEVHALDYVLKPFDRERLNAAANRAVELIQSRQSGQLTQRLSSLISELKPESKAGADRLAVKADGKVLFIKIEDLDWVEAADNYVNLHVGNDSHMHRETMSSIESRLPTEKFIRISRSTIVNIERIKELQPMFHGDYVVILRNGTRLNLSRSHRDKINFLLGKSG